MTIAIGRSAPSLCRRSVSYGYGRVSKHGSGFPLTESAALALESILTGVFSHPPPLLGRLARRFRRGRRRRFISA